MPSAICYPPFAIRHLPSATCYPPPANCLSANPIITANDTLANNSATYNRA